jgi:hypothetical protein
MMDSIELFTNREAAKILRLSPVSLWRRRQARKIGYRRDNGKIFYSRDDIEQYLARNHQPASLDRAGNSEDSQKYVETGSKGSRTTSVSGVSSALASLRKQW